MASLSKSVPILCNRSFKLHSLKNIKYLTFVRQFESDGKDNYSQVSSIILR